MSDATPLASWLHAHAERQSAAGNETFALQPPEQAWYVEAGSVEVFVTRGRDGGRRRHLGTALPGQLLFGFPADDDLRLLAAGGPDTRLRRLARADLQPLVRAPELLAEVTAAVDGWLGWLLREVPHPPAPRDFQELAAGGEVELAAEQAVRPQRGVVWFRQLAGSCHFLGDDALPLAPAGFLLPLVEPAWLRAGADGARLSGVPTATLLRSGSLWAGLDGFHRLCLGYLQRQLLQAEQAEHERLRAQLERNQQVLAGAHARLAGVLGTAGSPTAGAGDDAPRDVLLAACALVAEHLGATLKPPPDTASRREPLVEICAASRLRHRRVILRDTWWQRDNGPLLAFRTPAAEGQAAAPVALLPTSTRSYQLVDPASGQRQAVDAAVAETLSGEAVMLYPPLPERPLDHWDLLRMALRDRRRDLGTILLMGLGGGLLALLAPVLSGQIVTRVIPEADRSLLLSMSLALAASALAAAAFQVTRSIAVLRLGGKIDGTVQAALWDRLLSLPATFFRRFTVGDLAVRAMGLDAIREMLTGNVLTSLLGAVFSVFSFALLFYYSWRLALLASGLVAVLLAVTLAMAYLQLRHQRALLELQGKLESLLFGLIYGIAKLRVAGAEARAYALWAARFSEQRRRAIQARKVANVQTAFNAAYAVLTSMSIFAMAGLSGKATLPVGEFIAFNAAYGQFQGAALAMIGLLSTLLAAVPIYERAQPILQTPPEVDEAKIDAGPLRGDLEFSHVSFRYRPDGPLILDDVSFRAQPGEFIALVGPSGSGKSTCLRLILAFEQPAAGSIYFDGQDLPALNVQSVRRQIGVVLQTSQPMSGTVFSNISGGANLSMPEVWAAAELAGLADDIRQLPMGMHTVVSEGGTTFSGGQRQRLLIARALVHRPRILLFDEATSALDNRTQDLVSQSLERLKATRIVVAHRLSTIRNADRIYVLERGRIVEQGSYEDLVRQGGPFARLVARQVA